MKKYVDGVIIEMTPEEIAELQSIQAEQTPTEPTIGERMDAIEGAIMELAEVICGG